MEKGLIAKMGIVSPEVPPVFLQPEHYSDIK